MLRRALHRLIVQAAQEIGARPATIDLTWSSEKYVRQPMQLGCHTTTRQGCRRRRDPRAGHRQRKRPRCLTSARQVKLADESSHGALGSMERLSKELARVSVPKRECKLGKVSMTFSSGIRAHTCK